jgi:hypothetical protein
MAAKKKFPKPTEARPHQCQFCGVLFARESSLFSHMCERKRRHFARDDRWVKLAFAIFERSYRLLGIARSRSTAMTYDDFADSQFYNGFVRFARHAADLGVENIQQFADWLVKNTVPLDDWCRLTTYEQYLKWVVENEPAATAVERNVLFMEKWAEETGHRYTDFFRAISPGEALMWIKTAKISPWMMFLSDTGGDLIGRMTEEQQGLLDQAVDIAKWKRKFLARSDDREWVKDICGQFGL